VQQLQSEAHGADAGAAVTARIPKSQRRR
jgi:hypothetical protein